MTSCQEYDGLKDGFGYGFVTMRGVGKVLAHRLAWALHNGADPAGKVVMHTCDNPPCINPEHLVLGTQKDNMNDMRRKGRAAKREGHGNAKLTEATVAAIRAATGTQCAIAAEFGTTQSNVSLIKNGQHW
jgi:hypothetical protein